MTGPSSVPVGQPPALADAEEWARWAADHEPWEPIRPLMTLLLAEYDRRGRALDAARPLLAQWADMNESYTCTEDMNRLGDLLDALAAAVRAHAQDQGGSDVRD